MVGQAFSSQHFYFPRNSYRFLSGFRGRQIFIFAIGTIASEDRIPQSRSRNFRTHLRFHFALFGYWNSPLQNVNSSSSWGNYVHTSAKTKVIILGGLTASHAPETLVGRKL